jgi:hypothetical protein
MAAAACRSWFLAVALLTRLAAPAPVVELAIDGSMFSVNGQTKFLVFVSYFDALDSTPASLRSDFSALKKRGVDGVRIMPNWWAKTSTESPNGYSTRTIVSPAGSAVNLTKLRSVLDIARDAGLVVDLSFTFETLRACPKPPCAAADRPANPLTVARVAAALASVARDLGSRGSAYAHVDFDIQNESNLWPAADRELDAAAVAEIAAAIRAADPKRIVTASRDQNISPVDTAAFAETATLDLVTWHESRMASWWTHTAEWIAAMRARSAKPIYLQEPEPQKKGGQWTLPGIKANLLAAKTGGAAAWCFHTHAGYYLDDGSSWFKHLTPEESAFLGGLAAALREK